MIKPFVTHYSLTDKDALARDWQALEGHADCPVFLSWQWIGVWLKVYQPAATVIKVTVGDTIIGLGLLVEKRDRRHGVLTSRCLRLHQTGNPEEDQIWIEYNGFLVDREHIDAVDAAVVRYMQMGLNDWDEWQVGAIDAERAAAFLAAGQLKPLVRWEAPCYAVNLAALRRTATPYLSTLSTNTRGQIVRAQRIYEQRGAVRVIRPTSLDEALRWFSEIGPQHMARWGTGPSQSGFANPHFVRFHEAFIRAHWAQGGVDLVAVAVGDTRIATFYNFIYRNQVYFYLGGLQVEQDNKLKPGLLGHSLCLQAYLRDGRDMYDFMGGDERYKRQLGQWHARLIQVVMQRDRLKFRWEQAAREAKQRWLGRRSNPAGQEVDAND